MSNLEKNPFENAIGDIVEAAKETNAREDGDYIGEDGLLYCGKCHTRKERILTIFGDNRKVPMNCACRQAAYVAMQADMRRKQLDIRRDEAFALSEMKDWTFANDDGANPKLTEALKRYVDGFPRMIEKAQGIMLYGNSGTGKTFAACEVANALIDKGYRVFVSSFSRMANAMQSTWDGRQEYLNDLARYQLIVIDDLGVERQTQYMQETVYNIVDARYRSRLPMIVTTNLDISEIKKPSDVSNTRIYDRLIEMCFPIEVKGCSRRRGKVRENYFEIKQFLGL